MRNLPVEILEEIMNDISPHDLLQIRSVNKTFCSIATPGAFREITVHTTEKSAETFLNLLDSPDPSGHVRSITLVEDFSLASSNGRPNNTIRGDVAKAQDIARYKRVRSSLELAFGALHQCPALNSLTLLFNPNIREAIFVDSDVPPSRFSLLQWDVLGAVARNPNPLPALRSLTIDKWLALPHSLYAEAPLARIVASLEHLRVSVWAKAQHRRPHLRRSLGEFWRQVVEQRMLRPAVNLESLAIGTNLQFGSRPWLDLNSITYPRLTTLSFENIVWESSSPSQERIVPGVEDFIVRHGKTLERLHVCDCVIQSFAGRPPLRSWANIWNRFADALTELVDLTVESGPCDPSGHADGNSFHLHFNMAHGYYNKVETERDAPALEAFRAIVEARKAMPNERRNE